MTAANTLLCLSEEGLYVLRLWVLWASSLWILWRLVTSDPGASSKTCSQASVLGCLLTCLLHPRFVQGYQVLGGSQNAGTFPAYAGRTCTLEGKLLVWEVTQGG